jgi:hypothetical protein
MTEREDNVYKAKLAEQAERYDGELISDMLGRYYKLSKTEYEINMILVICINFSDFLTLSSYILLKKLDNLLHNQTASTADFI